MVSAMVLGHWCRVGVGVSWVSMANTGSRTWHRPTMSTELLSRIPTFTQKSNFSTVLKFSKLNPKIQNFFLGSTWGQRRAILGSTLTCKFLSFQAFFLKKLKCLYFAILWGSAFFNFSRNLWKWPKLAICYIKGTKNAIRAVFRGFCWRKQTPLKWKNSESLDIYMCVLSFRKSRSSPITLRRSRARAEAFQLKKKIKFWIPNLTKKFLFLK